MIGSDAGDGNQKSGGGKRQLSKIGETNPRRVDELPQMRTAEGLQFGGVLVAALGLEQRLSRAVGGMKEEFRDSFRQERQI